MSEPKENDTLFMLKIIYLAVICCFAMLYSLVKEVREINERPQVLLYDGHMGPKAPRRRAESKKK